MRHLSDIDLRLIRIFCTIVDCSGFAGAQIALNMAQSTLSTHLSVARSQARLEALRPGPGRVPADPGGRGHLRRRPGTAPQSRAVRGDDGPRAPPADGQAPHRRDRLRHDLRGARPSRRAGALRRTASRGADRTRNRYAGGAPEQPAQGDARPCRRRIAPADAGARLPRTRRRDALPLLRARTIPGSTATTATSRRRTS